EDADAGLIDADRVERGEADLDAVVEIERHAERKDQDRADHIAVADHDDSLVAMRLDDLEHRGDGAVLHRAHALAAGDRREAAMGAPRLPARVVADRIKGRAGPFAEIELDQAIVVD